MTFAIIGLTIMVTFFAIAFYLIVGLQLAMAYATPEEEKKESLCLRSMTPLEFIITGTWLKFTRSGFWLICSGFLALFIGILNP
ncbi:MAG: hypothetical protein H0V70_02570 [Ktedonobacteraceae bacterium]|nr:hypothetical protein [Ktedonobacteraceae bacterium]